MRRYTPRFVCRVKTEKGLRGEAPLMRDEFRLLKTMHEYGKAHITITIQTDDGEYAVDISRLELE